MSRSTVGWVAIVGAFAAWELLHLVDGVPGGTFSELVWDLTALHPAVWWGGLVASVAGAAWGVYHLFFQRRG